mgnify:CR=1 FL=1
MKISKILKTRQVKIQGEDSVEPRHDGVEDDHFNCQHDYEIALLIYFIQNIHKICWQ